MLDPTLYLDAETSVKLITTYQFVREVLNRVETEYDVLVDFHREVLENEMDEDIDLPEIYGMPLRVDVWFDDEIVYSDKDKDPLKLFGRLDAALRPIGELLVHVVDSARGIYSAQIFTERFHEHLLNSDLDISPLHAGPDHEHHAETWEELVLRGRFQATTDDPVYTIHENDGVFLVREDITELESKLYFE
jgi:hypothetical protein